MSWVRLDDGSPGHRKIVGLSDAAFRLWIVGLTYCNQQARHRRSLGGRRKRLDPRPVTR